MTLRADRAFLRTILPSEAWQSADPERRPFRIGAGLPGANATLEILGRRKDGTDIPVELELAVALEGDRRLTVASLVEVGNRHHPERRIKERTVQESQFGHVVADLAARLVSLPPGEVDEAIVESQRQIVLALGIDRCILWQLTDDGTELIYTHAWVRPGLQAPPTIASAKSLWPWFLEKIRANEAVWFQTVDEIRGVRSGERSSTHEVERDRTRRN
jgi:hypothetical protein